MFPILETSRCRLRPFVQVDLPFFTHYRQQPDVARFQSWSDYSLEEAEALLHACQTEPFGAEGSWYQIALAERVTDRLLGDLALHFVDEQSVEVGFTLSPSAQGHGYISEGLQALLAYVFERRGVLKVLATTDALNFRSVRVLERAGFERVGEGPRLVIFKDAPGEELDFCLSRGRWQRGNEK